jgi:cytochrome c biogenesis protein CcdA
MTDVPPMPDADHEAVRRRVAHELYIRLGLYSAVVWTLGTFLLFITFAAGNPKPIFPAMLAMTAPLIAAALPWLFYRWLTARITKRRIREARARRRDGADIESSPRPVDAPPDP